MLSIAVFMTTFLSDIRSAFCSFFIMLALSHISAYGQTDSSYIPITSYKELTLKTDSTPSFGQMVLEQATRNADKLLHLFVFHHRSAEFAIYPAASYSGQSGLAAGIMQLITIQGSEPDKLTTITPCILISTKGMYEVDCDAEVFLTHHQTINAELELFYQPDDYFGLASDNNGHKQARYNIYRFSLEADYQKGIGQYVKFGPAVDFTNHRFKKINLCDNELIITDSLSISNSISNAQGWTNAIGLSASFDSRDNNLNPHHGWFIITKFLSYRKWLQSRHQFTSFMLDVRRYFPIGNNTVLAIQHYGKGLSDNNAPYTKMATCGGSYLGRAIGHSMKYVDRFAWLTQAELRFPLFWRIGATSWLAIGNVSHTANHQLWHNTHKMAGLGLRFKALEGKGLNIRLDGGITTHGEKAFIFNIREAF